MARAAATATVVSIMLAGSAHAQPSAAPIALEVSARRCTWLDEAELRRLTRLELGGPARSVQGGLSVDFACAGDDVTIGLWSEQASIRVERLVTGACCDDVEPERTLALLSLGLFTAARPLLGTGGEPSEQVAGAAAVAEPDGSQTVVLPAVNADGSPTTDEAPILAPAPAPPSIAPARLPAPPPVAATPHPAVTIRPSPPIAAFRPDRIDPPSEPPIHELGLDARLRLFNLAQPLAAYAAAATYRAWPWARFGLGGWFEAALGSAQRRGGEIDARVLSLGATASWRALVVDPFTLRLEGRGGLSYVRLEGQTTDPSAFGRDATDGVTGSLAFVAAPTLRSGRAAISLPIEIGGLFRAPRGEVANDDPVQLDGAVFSAGLAVSYGFGRRDGEPRWEARR
ncbi:MAG TPA: hypothetical protein ENK57_19165 [Polyangiaceae bacterium]|nr:hypothetical protein [Polyangiaceae bacterium]